MSRRIELPESKQYDIAEDKELLEKSFKSTLSIEEVASFRYDVDKSSSDWIVTFRQFSTIRIHTSKGYYPYMDDFVSPNNDLIKVKPNQWLEGKINGRWALLSEADHR